MQNFFDKLLSYMNKGLPVVKCVVIILIGYMCIKVFISILKRGVNRSKIERTIPNFLISLLNIGLIGVLIISVLRMIGISTDNVVTIASVISLGISLALQDTISGIANGFLLVTTKPFVEGEFVSINNIDGTIVSITMFNTVLKTADGLMVTMPNSTITKSSIKNFSRLPIRRIAIDIPVAYGTKSEVVKKIILDVCNSHKNVLKNPSSSVRLTEYGDSNLVFTLKCWVQSDVFFDTKFDLMEGILDALVDNNISIDYNQVDLHIKDIPSNISLKGGSK